MFLASGIILAALFFYFGFVHKSPEQAKLRAAFYMTLVIVFIFAHFEIKTRQSLSELAVYIPPYPHITEVVYFPREEDVDFVADTLSNAGSLGGVPVPEQGIQDLKVQAKNISKNQKYFILHTKDSPSQVISFYSNSANQNGWKAEAVEQVGMVFKKNGNTLIITATVQAGKTVIIYDLEILNN
jgi:hypothetical protein